MEPETKKRRRYRGGLFWPAILILLGVIFLLSNLNLLSGDAWSNLINLWPLLLIAGGLDGLFRREGMVGSALIFGVGVVLLLSNFGYLSISIWELLRWWPLLIIAIGLDVLIGRHSLWASLAGVVLILAMLGGAVWFSGGQVRAGQPLATNQISQSLDGAKQAQMNISLAAGELRVKAISGSNNLVEGSVPSDQGLKVTSSYTVNGEEAVYTLRQQGSAGVFIPGSRGAWIYDLGLNQTIPLDLKVEMGAGQILLDLTGLKIEKLQSSLGAGQMVVILPDTGSFTSDLHTAVGQVMITIPARVGARVRLGTALASSSLPPGYQKQGDWYVSPNYATATNKVDLNVSVAIGSVVVK